MTRSLIKRRATALIAAAAVACVASASAQPFALKGGQTVAFYGDSITALRFYTRDVEEFVLTRYPELHIRFENAGVPGDTAAGGYTGTMPERVARDVAPWQPKMITVMLGMNDGGWGYGQPAQIEADFQSRYKTLLDALHQAAPAATFTLISPTPYDEITHGTEFPGYSRMIDRSADDVTRIAAQMQSAREQSAGEPAVLFADFHRPMVQALQQAHAHDPQLAPLLIPDRIHPAEAGQWIMAAALMSAWHVDPEVSSVAFDAANANILKTDRATVTNLSKSTGGLEWTELDQALPLPLDFNNAMTPLLLKISNVADLDHEMLRVASLAPGRYSLNIDGKQVAIYSREELAHGVNLALQKTPMLSQARSIASTEDQRAELDQAGFILSANLKQQPPTFGIAEATLRAAQDELDAEMREDLSLKPHQFALRRVGAGQPVSGDH
jgi:lysophospholipase L1-like esterase